MGDLMDNEEIAKTSTANLWELFNSSTGTERADLGMELESRLVSGREWVEAIAVLEAVLQIPDISIEHKAHAHFRIGFANYTLKRYQESVAAYQASHDLSLEISDSHAAVIAARNMVEGYLEMSLFSIAFEKAESAIAVAIEGSREFLLGDLYMRMSHAEDGMGHTENALMFLEKARDNFYENENSDGMVYSDSFRLELLARLDRTTELIEAASRAMAVAKNLDNFRMYVLASRFYLNALIDDGQFRTALVELANVENVVVPPQRRLEDSAYFLSYKARATAGLGEVVDAWDLCKEGVAVAESAGLLEVELQLLNKMWEIAEYLEALEWMRTAAELMLSSALTHNNQRAEHHARSRLVQVEVEEGNFGGAHIHLLTNPEVDTSDFQPHVLVDRQIVWARYHYATGNHLEAANIMADALVSMNSQQPSQRKATSYAIRALALADAGVISPGDLQFSQALAICINQDLETLAKQLAVRMLPPLNFNEQLELDIS